MLFYLKKNKKIKKRKGQITFQLYPPDETCELIQGKRASYATFFLKGSLTVEASIVFPFFIGAVVALLFFLQAIQIQVQIQKALYNQTMKVTGYGYYLDSVEMGTEAENLLEVGYIKLMVIEELGDDFFEGSCIVNGKNGFNLDLTNSFDEDVVDVAIRYSLRVPFDIFGIGKVNFIARARCKTWTGADASKTEWDVDMVYMTSHGEVYHLDENCTYIKSDISSCSLDEIENIRNASGGIYYLCSLCGDMKQVGGNEVYYTQYGSRYHMIDVCSNLKNNVFAIEKEVAMEKYRSCSKCGTKGV